MHKHLYLLIFMPLFGCAANDLEREPRGLDAGVVQADAGLGREADTGTGSSVPDWVNPEVPEGPIPATDGTHTTPEEEDFDWSDVGSQTIGDFLPGQNLNWDHGNIFSQNPNPFSYKLNKICWEPPKITSHKCLKTSPFSEYRYFADSHFYVHLN